jgi:hypothetical protein
MCYDLAYLFIWYRYKKIYNTEGFISMKLVMSKMAQPVMLLSLFRKCGVGILARTMTIFIKVFCGFPQTLQASAKVLP